MPSRLARCVSWQGPFVSYARNFVRANYWRVASTIGGEDDAMQECALVFTKCFRHYEHTVDNPAWFMSLYKMALSNHWHTLAMRNALSRKHDAEIVPDVEYSAGPLMAVLQSASDELRYVLSVLADAPAEIMQTVLGGRTKEQNNARLTAWAGIEHGVPDLLGELKSLLEE